MDYIISIMPNLLQGLELTVLVFLGTLLLSLPLGLPFALGSNVRFWPIKFLCKLYIFIFRGTPLLLQLFFFYFGLAIAFGIKFSPFTASVITFVLNYAAYFAEIYRGGINSIDKGQYEAAHALGLSKKQTFLGIVLPQTVRVVLPAIGNEAIVLIKDTALISSIGVMELLQASKGAVNRDGVLTAYFVAAVFYLALTFVLTLVENAIEKKYSKYKEGEV
ncbi:MAG: amino acid ABC transporter permease [Eubacteriales bacterium]|nr:amino acid ABC transporter permease [Eubacteriales bacterium]